jgi:O-antigen/teichoic acid export membrane protein
MLLRHGIFYLLTRLGAGIFNLAKIVLYTYLLTPEQYGRYALLIAGVGLVSGIATSWLGEGVLRFTHSQSLLPVPFHTIRRLQVQTLLIPTGFAVLLLPFAPSMEWRILIAIGIGILWLQSTHDLQLWLFRAQLQPDRFLKANFVRTVVTPIVGWCSISIGLGSLGAAIGYLGGLFASIVFVRSPQSRSADAPITGVARELWRYGAPLSLSYLFLHILHTSDRFLIALFLGEDAAGAYAAVYELTAQTMALFLLSAANASAPLIFKAASEEDKERFYDLLRENLALLLTIGILGVVMWWKVAPVLVMRFIGSDYRDNFALIALLVATATLVADLRTHHFTIPLKINKKTSSLIMDTFFASLANILLSLWFIPQFGIVGAALATLVSYIVLLTVGAILARRMAFIVVSWKDLACILLCGGGVALFLSVLPSATEWQVLFNGLLGGIIYVAGILACNVAEWRYRLWRCVNRRSRAR